MRQLNLWRTGRRMPSITHPTWWSKLETPLVGHIESALIVAVLARPSIRRRVRVAALPSIDATRCSDGSCDR